MRAQYEACVGTKNVMKLLDTGAARGWVASLGEVGPEQVQWIPEEDIASADYQAVLFEGDGDALRELNRVVAARPGPIVSVQGLSSEDIAAGQTYRMERLLREVSVSINTTAAGGNASLMMIG